MKTLLTILLITVTGYAIARVDKFTSEDLVQKKQMIMCYNAEGNGYLWPVIRYRCALVPRGKGW